ncbi:GNAT family N-acetyltransferase [Kordiimonas lacus]|uniref:Acetyltransferase (GNAT) family protein n=1 Tax=Kordiimonas lacus TaxID=637679 RepID=A0A1G6WV50_9PROT|nr:GNAT family N-acetyltransferase [Kordiimonas lacus]SDD69669.1 Acetyltransferase (GNAT) family protein [Kordiimonas lacus]
MSDFCVKHDSLPYHICTNIIDFDFSKVHNWLSNAYWSEGIPMATVVKGFTNSLAFGLFHTDKGQVGCARMITDKATFAYLADVYVDAGERGNGLGYWMMEVIMAHPELQGLRRMMLATADMHPLYRKFGFEQPAKPDRLMEKLSPDVYKVLYSD